MKTYKIQPREQNDHTGAGSLYGNQLLLPRKRQAMTPTSERPKLDVEGMFGRDKSFVTAQSKVGGRLSKHKNKSLVENPYSELLSNLRIMATECSALLDNEMFRLKTEAEIQRQEVMEIFEDLGNRLMRKLNYLNNYIDQQLNMVLKSLMSEKQKLDDSLEYIDRVLESKSQTVTSNEIFQIQQSLMVTNIDIPAKITFPQIADSDELYQTFTGLIEGHICKKEIEIGHIGVVEHNNRIGSLFDIENNCRFVNTTSSNIHRDRLMDFSRSKQKSYDVKDNRIKYNTTMGVYGKPRNTVDHLYGIMNKMTKDKKEHRSINRNPTPKNFKVLTQSSSEAKSTVDLECHEAMEAILPRAITHIEEESEEENS